LVIRAFNATDVGRCTPSDDDLMSDGHRCAGWVTLNNIFPFPSKSKKNFTGWRQGKY